MKKILVIMLCALLTFSLVACGGDSKTEEGQPEESATVEASEQESEQPSEETAPEESTAPATAEEEPSDASAAEGFTEVQFGEISFEINNKYKYVENAESENVKFQFEPDVAWGSVVTLDKMDMLEDTDEDMQLDLQRMALVSGFDETETLLEEDTTIAGVPAKIGQYIVTHSGTTIQFIPAVFYGKDSAYAFMLDIADGVDGSEYITAFMEMLQTVKFV